MTVSIDEIFNAAVAASLLLAAACDSSAGDGAQSDVPVRPSSDEMATDAGGTTELAGGCGPVGADSTEVLDLYMEAWGEPDEAARLCLLERSVMEDATFADPTAALEGRQLLSDHIGGLMETLPGAYIEPKGTIDARKGGAYFGWEYVSDGEALATGQDFVELAADGRLQHIVGFWEPYAPSEPEGVFRDLLDAWSTTDPQARRALLADAWSEDGRYTDANVDLRGAEALAAYMETGSADVHFTPATLDAHLLEQGTGSLRIIVRGADAAPEFAAHADLDVDGKIARMAVYQARK
jgi:hypothetical protein